jgi:hypothetical protein
MPIADFALTGGRVLITGAGPSSSPFFEGRLRMRGLPGATESETRVAR